MHRGGPVAQSWLGLGRLGAPGLALALAVLALAIGCTRDAGAGDLDARARRYMELRQKGDFAAIYDQLLDPQLKGTLERDKFMARRKSTFEILEFHVETTQRGAAGAQGVTEATVVAQIEAMMPIRRPGGGVMSVRRKVQDDQKWVKRDGGWYIRLKG